MSQAILGSSSRPSIVVRASLLFAAVEDALRRAGAILRTRQAVADLSDDQLKDAGIDRAALFGNRPTIQVPPRLMSSLMLMR